MEVTLEQALKQGVAAHKSGKLPDAERLYRAILESHPLHPDANHNLGLLAIGANRVEVALPLFRTALEAKPKIEQFWLSYINALLKDKQNEVALKVIEQASKQGVAREKLNVLEMQIASANEKEKICSINPSQQQLSNLLKRYQNGQFTEAEQLALSMTQEFPEHTFSWKVLGIIFRQQRRMTEAVEANQTAAILSPQDAETYNNLSVTLEGLGRLEEAEAGYGHAIALKPDYLEAYGNLGNILQKLGRLDEAERNFTEAVALKPSDAEAHGNLGNILQELGKLNEAEASYSQAIALKSDYAEAHYNLGNMLQRLGVSYRSEASYKKAIVLRPDFSAIYSNLGVTLNELGRLDEAGKSYTQAIVLKPDFADAHSNLGNIYKKLDRLEEAEASYDKAIALKPDFTKALMNRWQLLFDKREFDAALKDIDLCNNGKSRACSLETLYALGRTDEIYKRIELNAELDDKNIRMAAFSSFFAEQEKKNNAHKFCQNPLPFLYFSNISSHREDSGEFIRELIDELKNLQTIWEPDKKATSVT